MAPACGGPLWAPRSVSEARSAPQVPPGCEVQAQSGVGGSQPQGGAPGYKAGQPSRAQVVAMRMIPESKPGAISEGGGGGSTPGATDQPSRSPAVPPPGQIRDRQRLT